jgi:DNA repair exonuclease SbcCD ATPase subunit
MEYPLSIAGDGYRILVTPEAEQAKRKAIEAASAIVTVPDQTTYDQAKAAVARLAYIRIETEKSRIAIKQPVLEVGRLIDGTARDFAAEVIAEETRLDAEMKAFVREQQRIAREAREAAERERQRIEREEHERKMEALRKEQEAERQRMEAERQKHAAEMARLKAEREADEAAQAEARRKAEEAARAQKEAADRAYQAQLEAERVAKEAREREVAAAVAVTSAEQVVPSGVREVIDFEVVDIQAFAAKFPQLVTITPKRAEILAALKKSFAKNRRLPEVAGLRVFQNLKI